MSDVNAGAQQQISTLSRDQPWLESKRMSTFLPMDPRPDLPPNMRNWTRFHYVEEYIGYWKYEQVTRVLGISLLALGVLALPVFTPGALVTLAVAGRYLDLCWWYNFIVHKFGINRTLALVD